MGADQRSGDDQGATRRMRLTVAEAAEALGISGDAVRSRIKRGTLETVREGGRVFVLVGDQPTAQARPTRRPGGEDRLYEEMQARIRYLESQVEEEREARRRADTLLARLMDRLPELEAPQEAPPETPGSPERAQEEPERGSVPEAPETPAEVRPWWRRMFGG